MLGSYGALATLLFAAPQAPLAQVCICYVSREPLTTLRQLTILYFEFSYNRQPTKTPRQLSRSLSTMMGVCRRLPDGCFPPTPETRALCRAGPHGSTLQDRLATRAAGVARGKAAQAGLRQTVAAAPAQAAVQLWTLGALPPNTSETRTLVRPQRYGARGRSACPCDALRCLWLWQRCATTRVYSCFYWCHVRPAADT